MNYQALATDLTTRGFAASGDAQAAATAMNALTTTATVHTPVNERTIGGALGIAGVTAVLTALTSAAANGLVLGGTTYPAVTFQYILRQLQNAGAYASPGGLDSGDPEFAEFVGLLAGAGVLTAAQAATLTALGTTTTSYVQATYGVPALTAADVMQAFGAAIVFHTSEGNS